MTFIYFAQFVIPSGYLLFYSVAAHFIRGNFPEKTQKDPKNYFQWICDNLDLDGMNFPSGLNSVKTLVTNNPELDLNISVYVLNNNEGLD